MSRFDDETLVAYVDGELDRDQRAAVEAALATDPQVRERLTVFEQSADAMARAFGSITQLPLPSALVDAVTEGRTPAGAVGEPYPPDTPANPWYHGLTTSRWREGLGFSLAAGVTLAVALFAGYSIGQSATGTPGAEDRKLPERHLAAAHRDTFLGVARSGSSSQALTRVLETSVSGRPVALSRPGTEHTVEPTLTFSAEDGRYCREYVERVGAGGGAYRARGIACRNSNRVWVVELYRREGPMGGLDSYQPASELPFDPVGRFVERYAKGPPLDAPAEDRALRSGWQ